MMRVRTWIAGYLALCLALAGTVGINPTLHRLIEHGGDGPAHAHSGFTPASASAAPLHQHGDAHWHADAPASPPPAGLFQHGFESFRLPTVALSRLWHGLTHLFGAKTSSQPAPSEGDPGHEHHSLFQLLASGLVEPPLVVEILPSIPLTFASRDFMANTPLVASEWDAQTASRGPPSSGS